MSLNPVIAEVTARIVARSQDSRSAYLANMEQAIENQPGRAKLSCANWAHAFAASPGVDKVRALDPNAPNIGIVSAYNDMLSAHQPLEAYPALIKDAARDVGATAQFAGGVPAMCDGVTQGRPGMELSLFSRDVIAMATAVALTHDAFDAVMALGVQHIVICGHSDCGAMKAVLNPASLETMPTVKAWLRHAEVARSVVAENCNCSDDKEALAVLTEENVVAQLNHLCTHPSVAAKLARGQLFIHGWVYDIETSQIKAYDAELGSFLPLDGDKIPMATPRARFPQS